MSVGSLEQMAERIRLLALAAQMPVTSDDVKADRWPSLEPSSFWDAMESAHAPQWIKAMNAELQSMKIGV